MSKVELTPREALTRSASARSSKPAVSGVAEVAVPDRNRQAVERLEQELRAQARRKWWQRAVWLCLLLAAVGAWWWWRSRDTGPVESRFRTRAVEQRDIVEQVESTGRLKPLKEVQIGAQVSGRVVKVLVDFNSRVKAGQLLAEIDPQLLGAQVGQVTGQIDTARANVERGQARLKALNIDLARVTQLAKEGLASQAEVDQASSALDVAKAEALASEATLTGLRSQLNSARTSLTYTKIYSPIDGIVISRTVEPGQTMAANFAAPVLFVIAEDLSKMQAFADIDEADVGKVQEGMSARVMVDAFAGEQFAGTVTQIRYSPTEVQGVVTYAAVIDVANPDLKLRPGMTATVSITTRKAEGVLAAPNAALRFKPEEKERDLTPLAAGQVRVYRAQGVLGQETLSASSVQAGLTDGVWTELKGTDLQPGALLVTEQADKVEKKRRFMGMF